MKQEKFQLTVMEPSEVRLQWSNQRVDYNMEARKQEDIIQVVGNGMRSLQTLTEIRDFDIKEEVKRFRERLIEFQEHEKKRKGMESSGGKQKHDAL